MHIWVSLLSVILKSFINSALSCIPTSNYHRPYGRLYSISYDVGVRLMCVGFSRVYFGVHFPTDVAGGFIAVALWLVITILIMQAADWHVARRRAARRRRR